MPLKIYKRPSGVWYLRGTVQDRRFDESTRTRDRSQAEQIRAKAEADAFRAHVYGEQSVETFADAALAYMQATGQRDHIDKLLKRFGHKLVTQVTQGMLDEMARERPTAAPATLLRQIYAPASAIINFGRDGQTKIGFRKPKLDNGRTAYLEPAEADAWISALPPHLSSLLMFLLASGCRITEALELDWKDVSATGERVVFWQTKGGYPRGVNLQRRARLALPPRTTGPVFLNSRGEPWHGYDAINLMFRRHRERLDLGKPQVQLPSLHCHLCRHTWATWAYAVTRDLTFLMAQGGWRSAGMVMRYTHVASADLATAVKTHGWEISGKSDFLADRGDR